MQRNIPEGQTGEGPRFQKTAIAEGQVRLVRQVMGMEKDRDSFFSGQTGETGGQRDRDSTGETGHGHGERPRFQKVRQVSWIPK